jgi:monoamine oxidase
MVPPARFVDVIIVGAGLSGLRAATELHSAGLSYVVLEAEDRVGGKTLSVPASSNGTGLVDMGAAWINDSNQSEMFALAEEFDFDLIVQRAEGDSLFQDEEGKVTSIEYGLPGAVSVSILKLGIADLIS